MNWADGGTVGKGLLYSCSCGLCREFKIEKANIKKVISAYERIIDKLLACLKESSNKK